MTWRGAVIGVCLVANTINVMGAVLDMYRRGVNTYDTFVLVASSTGLVGFTIASYLADKRVEVWDAQRLRYEAEMKTAEAMRVMIEHSGNPDDMTDPTERRH